MLNIKNLKKAYIEPDGRRLPILDVPHFSADAGEQLAMVGRSGCGKTTLLHTIAGISRPDAGEVRINGVDIASLPEAGRDRFRSENIGYVFQTFNLLPGFTAMENVVLGMTFSRGAKNSGRARELLRRVGLEERVHHKPSALSVGEQQRVAVARALANRPKLLLADEPTASVDASNQQHVMDLIRRSCEEEQVTLIVVTHAVEIASQFERVVHLEQINQATGMAAGIG
jgi:putative ABC transport system ATP-binding protein